MDLPLAREISEWAFLEFSATHKAAKALLKRWVQLLEMRIAIDNRWPTFDVIGSRSATSSKISCRLLDTIRCVSLELTLKADSRHWIATVERAKWNSAKSAWLGSSRDSRLSSGGLKWRRMLWLSQKRQTYSPNFLSNPCLGLRFSAARLENARCWPQVSRCSTWLLDDRWATHKWLAENFSK